MDNSKIEEVMHEITEFCGNECPSVTCCPEFDCVLYRIEQIVNSQNEAWRIIAE